MERARARVQQLSEHVSAGGGHKSATQQGEGAAGAPVCLVVGAGPAIGAAVCRKFASQGWTVVAVRRRGERELEELCATVAAECPRGRCVGWHVDAREESQVAQLVQRVEQQLGRIECCVHNIGANVRSSLAATTPRVYRKVWELTALSAFLLAREVLPRMAARKQGTFIFTGATASVRGASGFAAFSGGMHGKRALAQAAHKEFAAQGVHVAHVVIDGPVDTNFVRQNFPALVEKHREEEPVMVNPEAVGELYYFLHEQPRSAWTHELDLRPFAERSSY